MDRLTVIYFYYVYTFVTHTICIYVSRKKFDEFIKNKSKFQMSKTYYKNLFNVSTEFDSK